MIEYFLNVVFPVNILIASQMKAVVLSYGCFFQTKKTMFFILNTFLAVQISNR